MNWRFGGVVLTSVLLAACQSMPAAKDWQQRPESRASFDASGRLAVKQNDKGSYANFDWSSNGSVQQLDVNTPLGNTVGQLCQDVQGVVAVASDGSRFEAATASELSERLMGFAIPVEALDVWAHGHWHERSPHTVREDGRLLQDGWVIERQVNEDGQPRLLLLESEQLSIRLLFSQYQSPSTLLETDVCERNA